MKKQYKLSITKNRKIAKKIDVVPLTGYVAS